MSYPCLHMCVHKGNTEYSICMHACIERELSELFGKQISFLYTS